MKSFESECNVCGEPVASVGVGADECGGQGATEARPLCEGTGDPPSLAIEAVGRLLAVDAFRSDAKSVARKPGPTAVAVFVVKRNAERRFERLLLVRSAKAGRAWELPGGKVEPGEELIRTAHREVVEETGVDFFWNARQDTFGECAVFFGHTDGEDLTPGDDAAEARWFTRERVRLVALSDFPTAALIRNWAETE